jgi:hypothetical protein
VGRQLSLSEVIAIDPEIGGVVAQALYWPEGRDRVFEELRAGASPAASIQAAIDPAFDSALNNTGPEHRQYAAMALDGRVAAFTGTKTLSFSDHRTGAIDGFVYSIQGNTLEGADVLDSLEGGLLSSEGGVGLRLIAALQAVAESGRGDSRCSPLTADAAYFELHVPGEAPLAVEIVTPDGDATTALAREAAPLLPDEPQVTQVDDSVHSTNPSASASGCQYGQGRSSAWSVGLLALLSLALLRCARPKRRPAA